MTVSLNAMIAGAGKAHLIHKGTLASGNVAAGRMTSLYRQIGIPSAAANPSGGLSGANISYDPAGLFYADAATGNQNYLARATLFTVGAGTAMIADRLWQSGALGWGSGAQTINTAAWPARDTNGQTNGEGVLIGIEVASALTIGTGTPAPTISYTNSAGVAGRTGTLKHYPHTTAASALMQIELEGNDKGVRSVESITYGATITAGSHCLVAYRPLCYFPLNNASPHIVDPVTGGMPRLYNGCSMFVALRANASVSTYPVGAYATVEMTP